MLRGKETERKFTFACKFLFKEYRIVEGDLVAIFPIFGLDVGSLEGKSISKSLNRSIAIANFLSAFSDIQFLASVAEFNASSAAINTLFNISQWNGGLGHNTGKAKERHFLKRMEEFKLGSWVRTKNRQANISSMARFRYALPSLFNDKRNDTFSRPKVGDGGPTEFVERSIRLDNE